jgi:hypothetical protein
MSYHPDEGYLSDGVYSDWWNWKDDEREGNQKLLVKKRVQWLNDHDSNGLSVTGFKNALFKETIYKGTSYACKRYCKLEYLPLEYALAALKNSFVSDIVASGLASYGLFNTVSEIQYLEVFIDNLLKNKNKKSAYARVTELQYLIHQKANDKNGSGAHLNLDRQTMRQILSFLRLFFLVKDAQNINLTSFKALIKKILENKKNPVSEVPAYLLESNRRFIPRWNERHQNTLLYFFPAELRLFIKHLIRDDLGISKPQIIVFLEPYVTERHLSE